MKTAFFRFNASASIGAGHAIRSCVIADALVGQGWICKVATGIETYNFISDLKRFDRIEPMDFYNSPPMFDLLVVDDYNLDSTYEKHFRFYSKKIIVIDDLANRQHECDVLLDQAYGRNAHDYEKLVPRHCQILSGSDYVLLRKEFIKLRPEALEKRRNTTEIKRVLVSMGGADFDNYTIKALGLIKESGFKGALDIVLGFSNQHLGSIKNYINDLPNKCKIYVDADMPKLIYEADLAIGAAGSSVWERCCLGMPGLLVKTASNQTFFLSNLSSVFQIIDFNHSSNLEILCKSLFMLEPDYRKVSEKISNMLDGMGLQRLLEYV